MAKHPRELSTPIGTNPLARHIGQLMEGYRKARGWYIAEAAAHLGVTPGHYFYLEKGRLLPGQKMAQRLRRFLVEKVDFEGAPPIREGHWTNDVEARRWKKVVSILHIDDATRLRQQARRLGLSLRDLAAVFIRMGLESKMAFSQLQDAVTMVNEARALQCLKEAPELRDLLRAEPEIIRATPELTAWTKIEDLRPQTEKFLGVSPRDTAKLDPPKLVVKDVQGDVEEL